MERVVREGLGVPAAVGEGPAVAKPRLEAPRRAVWGRAGRYLQAGARRRIARRTVALLRIHVPAVSEVRAELELKDLLEYMDVQSDVLTRKPKNKEEKAEVLEEMVRLVVNRVKLTQITTLHDY